MKPGARALPWMIAAGMAIIAICAGLGWWLSKSSARWLDEQQSESYESRLFASRANDRGCLQEAFARAHADPSLRSGVRIEMFLDLCLQEAGHSADFCKSVPPLALDIAASEHWRESQCAMEGLQPPLCPHMMMRVIGHCHEVGKQIAPAG